MASICGWVACIFREMKRRGAGMKITPGSSIVLSFRVGLMPDKAGGSPLLNVQYSQVLRAAKSRNHPALVRIEKISIGGADVRARRGERAAAQNLLAHKPFVVVFVKL